MPYVLGQQIWKNNSITNRKMKYGPTHASYDHIIAAVMLSIGQTSRLNRISWLGRAMRKKVRYTSDFRRYFSSHMRLYGARAHDQHMATYRHSFPGTCHFQTGCAWGLAFSFHVGCTLVCYLSQRETFYGLLIIGDGNGPTTIRGSLLSPRVRPANVLPREVVVVCQIYY